MGAGSQKRDVEVAWAGGKNRRLQLRAQRTQFGASCLSPVETVLAANEDNARKRVTVLAEHEGKISSDSLL